MAEGFDVRVDASDTRSALRQAVEAVSLEGARAPMQAAAVRALSSAAPRRTGMLARSARPVRATGTVAAARPTARYAGPVNSGVPSRGMRATNYVERAARSAEAPVIAAAERYLAREVRS